MQIENHHIILPLFKPWRRTIQLFLGTNIPVSSQVMTIYPYHPLLPKGQIKIGIANGSQFKFTFKEITGTGKLACPARAVLFVVLFRMEELICVFIVAPCQLRKKSPVRRRSRSLDDLPGRFSDSIARRFRA